jgi:hypothetical protein
VPGLSTIWIYRVDPREIHYLKFVLEAYDGMATLTTLDARTGLIQVSVPPGAQAGARILMEALGWELGLIQLRMEEDRC